MMHPDPHTHALLMLAEAVKQAHGHLTTGLLQPDEANGGWTNLLMGRLVAQHEVAQSLRATASRRVAASLDAPMVDYLALLLKAYLHRKGRYDLHVSAERTIFRKGVRPDVSVWKEGKNDVPVAVIEAKVQMGWNRTNVEEQFEKRDDLLTGIGVPHANIWHVVANRGNWAPSNPSDPRWGTRWIILHDGPWKGGERVNPIEPIFRDIASIP
jgi:hypothetical protein